MQAPPPSDAVETIARIGQMVLAGGVLTAQQGLELAGCSFQAPWELLYWADKVRRKHFGDTVRLCSIIAGKLGACSEDCKWCAQSLAHGRAVGGLKSQRKHPPRRVIEKPHIASKDKILSAARQATSADAACLGIVNSGRRPNQADLDAIRQAVAAIQADPPTCKLRVCASLGEITAEQARQLAGSGIFRYHHNLETSRRFFPFMVTTHSFDDRLRTITSARSAGMSVCCGGIFGLGETWEDRIDLAVTLRDQAKPDVAPMNFLHPIPGTPLENQTPLPPMEILSILAIFRLFLPATDIKVCGGRVFNLRDLQSLIFCAGASSCMVGNYLTTEGRQIDQDLKMISDLGLQVVSERFLGPEPSNCI